MTIIRVYCGTGTPQAPHDSAPPLYLSRLTCCNLDTHIVHFKHKKNVLLNFGSKFYTIEGVPSFSAIMSPLALVTFALAESQEFAAMNPMIDRLMVSNSC